MTFVMSWDAIITRGEAGEEPIGPYAEVGQWLTDFWQVADWGCFVSQDGTRFEIMVRTALDEAKWEFLDTHPTPSDPAQLPDYRKAIQWFEPKPTTPVTYISVAVRAGSDPLPSLKRFCAIHGLALLDSQLGEFVDVHDDSPAETDSFSEWRAFRNSLIP